MPSSSTSASMLRLDRAAATRAPPSRQPARVRRRVEERDVEAVLEELPRRAEAGPAAADDDRLRGAFGRR
eukprot:30872-Pelagococcus_subviridis.AAC.1